jgi:2-methylcitrate dehydratase PrpD
MKLLAVEYANYITGERFENLPEVVVLQTKKTILDLLGAALTSYGERSSQVLIDFIASLGGSEEATIFIKKKRKFPAMNAALANGFCANALEMDDGHRFGVIHPGAVVIPAAMATAEMMQTNGKNLIQGIVVGYEIMLRIAKASGPSIMKRGLNPTGVISPFGAAAASGKILNLSTGKMSHALALAGTQGGGLLELVQGGFITKSLNPAKAAMAGVLSAILAEKGLTGPETIFEGKNGFFKAMADEIKFKDLTDGLGKNYEICRTYTKLHASCRHTHAAIDCVLRIVKKYDVKPEQIDKVTIKTYTTAVEFGGWKTRPESLTDAKFSIPFCVALSIVKKNAYVEVFTEENLMAKKILDLAERVQVFEERRWTDVYPVKRGATLEISMKDGGIYIEEAELAKGEPECPITWQELSEKFHINSTRYITDDDSKRLEYLVMNLEEKTTDEMTAVLRK